MKRVLHLVALLFISVNLFAQAPQKMTYQAVIRNGSNNLITNAPVRMRISILQGGTSGTAVYSELHNPTTNANGLATIEIGSGTSRVGSIGSINWANGPYFLKSETDPLNGNDYTITGTSQLLSVPYALESRNATSATNAGNGISRVSAIGDTLYFNNGSWIIVPGSSFANKPYLNSSLTYGTLIDIEGNTYKTIQIGTQVWMAENLRTTKYRNGENIMGLQDVFRWRDNTTGAWSYYNFDPTKSIRYGALYNWYAVANTRNICPASWHVPTQDEWITLKNFLGGGLVAGGKMKAVVEWVPPNTGATNSSGFSALPGGMRQDLAAFTNFSTDCIWWSFTQNSTIPTEALYHAIGTTFETFNQGSSLKSYGFAVRCVKD